MSLTRQFKLLRAHKYIIWLKPFRTGNESRSSKKGNGLNNGNKRFPLSSLLLLYISTNWSWSQASPLMTRGDKRQEENSRLSRLLRKLDSVGLSISRGWQNAVRPQTMLGLNLREIESVSTGSDRRTDSRDKVAKGAKQCEQALHCVPVLSYPGGGCWEALGTGRHICTLDWKPGRALTSSPLSPPLVAWHVSPACYLWLRLYTSVTSCLVPEGVSRILWPLIDPIFLGWGPLSFNG